MPDKGRFSEWWSTKDKIQIFSGEKFNFNHKTYLYNFEAFKFYILKHCKYEEKNVCILKVTEDFGTDPHPDLSQNVTDPEHWLPTT